MEHPKKESSLNEFKKKRERDKTKSIQSQTWRHKLQLPQEKAQCSEPLDCEDMLINVTALFEHECLLVCLCHASVSQDARVKSKTL